MAGELRRISPAGMCHWRRAGGAPEGSHYVFGEGPFDGPRDLPVDFFFSSAEPLFFSFFELLRDPGLFGGLLKPPTDWNVSRGQQDGEVARWAEGGQRA